MTCNKNHQYSAIIDLYTDKMVGLIKTDMANRLASSELWGKFIFSSLYIMNNVELEDYILRSNNLQILFSWNNVEDYWYFNP